MFEETVKEIQDYWEVKLKEVVIEEVKGKKFRQVLIFGKGNETVWKSENYMSITKIGINEKNEFAQQKFYKIDRR